MPKSVEITPHLSVVELETRYRQCKDPVERSHYQIIWLLAQGRSTAEVSEVTSYSRAWLYNPDADEIDPAEWEKNLTEPVGIPPRN